MKNNLLGVNMEKAFDTDERLVSYSDLLELIVMNKIQRGDFDDIVEQMTAVLDPELEEDSDCCDDCEEALTDKTGAFDSDSRRLLCAGYTDCMEEAIRFLVEEENISPEHPVVRNLKAHLEQSKERILETASEVEKNNNNNSDRYHHPAPYHEFLVSPQCAWNTG